MAFHRKPVWRHTRDDNGPGYNLALSLPGKSIRPHNVGVGSLGAVSSEFRARTAAGGGSDPFVVCTKPRRPLRNLHTGAYLQRSAKSLPSRALWSNLGGKRTGALARPARPELIRCTEKYFATGKQAKCRVLRAQWPVLPSTICQ